MANLLRVDASVRTDGSVSRAVADTATTAWQTEHPAGTVTHRDLSAHPLPGDTWGLGVASAYAPPETWTPQQQDARALITTLADEVIAADLVVLASPLYNFGVSQYTKVWIDLLICDPRLGPGSTELQGTSALLVVAQGGGYRAGTSRHGWDHSTAYLERILADNFGMTVDTVVVDLTLAGVNPAMAHLTDAAAQALAEAHESAGRHGNRIATAHRTAA